MMMIDVMMRHKEDLGILGFMMFSNDYSLFMEESM
jgi:hypothetical protein